MRLPRAGCMTSVGGSFGAEPPKVCKHILKKMEDEHEKKKKFVSFMVLFCHASVSGGSF